MAGQITIGGSVPGMLTGSKTIGPVTIVGSAIVGSVVDVTLTVGDNTVAIPTTASAMMLEVGSGYGGSLTLRTTGSGDTTGIYISPIGPQVWRFDPAHLPASIILHASATGTAELTFI